MGKNLSTMVRRAIGLILLGLMVNTFVLFPGGTAEARWYSNKCAYLEFPLNEKKTSQLEGRLNRYSGNAAKAAAIFAAMPSKMPVQLRSVLDSHALTAALASAGGWSFAGWMQAVDEGDGVVLHFDTCKRFGIPTRAEIWPTANQADWPQEPYGFTYEE